MADLSDLNSSQVIKIVGSDSSGVEETPVSSSTLGELKVADVPNQTGLSGVLNLTTTAQEGKIGVDTLANRKYIEMQALTTNVKWGYDSGCPFDLFKNQFFALPAGTNCKIYFKASTGTAEVAFSEK